jgi:hypothetical protein
VGEGRDTWPEAIAETGRIASMQRWRLRHGDGARDGFGRPEDQEWTEGMSDRDSAPITPAGAAQRSHARGHHSADNST